MKIYYKYLCNLILLGQLPINMINTSENYGTELRNVAPKLPIVGIFLLRSAEMFLFTAQI